MKYKTLCRLLVKLMAIYLIAMGVSQLFEVVAALYQWFTTSPGSRSRLGASDWFFLWFRNGGQLVCGITLWFGSNWVTDRLIPSNRLYCPECGYDVSSTPGNVCNECGTVFRKQEVEPHH